MLNLPLTDYLVLEKKEIPHKDSLLFKIFTESEILVDNNMSDMNYIISRNNKAQSNRDSLYFVILPASFCNMGCTYCGQSHKKGGLTDALSDKIVDRIASAVQKTQLPKLQIGWFGGEPLVGYSKIIELSQRLIHIAEIANIKYSAKIVTNASLLSMQKLIELHEQCKINELHITFDGPEKIHDARRFLKKGGVSFIKVVTLIQQALQEEKLKKVQFVLRTNIDNENQPYIDEYLQYMHDAGFAHPNISFDLKPVYPWSNDVSAVEIQRKDYAEMEINWMIKALELGLNTGYLHDAIEIPCVALDPYAEVISSTGKLFSCTEHPLVDEHEASDFIGQLGEQWVKRRPEGQFDNFNEKVLTASIPCSTCKLLGVCGGACPKHWEEGYVPCPSLKYNLQDRLDILAIKMGYQIKI